MLSWKKLEEKWRKSEGNNRSRSISTPGITDRTVKDIHNARCRPSEAMKGMKAKHYLISLKEKIASGSKLKIIVDVGNVGHIKSVLEFFLWIRCKS
jgi:hypothetical protein